MSVMERVHVRRRGEEWRINRCSRDSACEKDEEGRRGGTGGQMFVVERGL